MFGPLRALTEEARAATVVKRDLPIMVVLGNPPYSGSSANDSRRDGELTWIGELIEEYTRVDGAHFGERSRNWLHDDYVKFIRFGQWRIQQSGAGILAFVTNHAYLNNPTFRGMRQQLMETFTDIYVLDLHGNARLRERTPHGGVDENVFDIQQGVAIGLFVKQADKRGPATVHHADLWGERQAKYAVLAEADVTTTAWDVLAPASPTYLFKPSDKELENEYTQWPKVTELLPATSTGIFTARDRLTIRWSRAEAIEVVRDFATLAPETARTKYQLPNDGSGWKVHWAQADLIDSGVRGDLVSPILYRPFDQRYTYYTGNSQGFIWRPRAAVMQNMLGGSNLGLCIGRAGQALGSETWNIIFVSRVISDLNLFRRGGHCLFPLYLYPSKKEIEQGSYERSFRRPNLSPRFTIELAERLGLEFVHDCSGDLETNFGPEDVFHYIYAVLYSPTYRDRYAEFLRADFPRIPPPSDLDHFRALAALGRELMAVHLLESPALDATGVGFRISGDNVVEQGHPKYVAPGETPRGETEPASKGRVYINASRLARGARPAVAGQYFDGIDPDVWEFRVGGYQPLHKWLKDRKARELTFDDLHHYGRIAAAMRETIRLMAAIDEAGLPFP